MAQNIVLGLMKLGKPEDMKRLYYEGEIYMQEISFFRQLEDDQQRADEHEGIFLQKRVSKLIIKDDNGEKREFKGSGILRGHYPDLKANIYCMHAFTSDLCGKSNVVDSRNHDFGVSFVLIYNTPVFMERLLAALREINFEPVWNLVEYYDDETDYDDLNVFNKPNKYEHQSEIRIFVENPDGGVIKFKIGSLEDIAELHETDTLNKMIFEIDRSTDQFRFGFLG